MQVQYTCMIQEKGYHIALITGGFNAWAAVRLLLPGVWLLWDPSLATLYAFLFSINVIGCLFMSVLVYYYTGLMLTNTTTHENNTNSRKAQKYNHGSSHNIKVRTYS